MKAESVTYPSCYDSVGTLLLISLAHQTHAYAHVPLASPARAHTSLLYGEEQRVGQAN